MAEAGTKRACSSLDSIEDDAGRPETPVAEGTAEVAATAAVTKGSDQNIEDGGTSEQFVSGGGEEWAALLALFSSNLSFAIEGPGRTNDHNESDKNEQAKQGNGTEKGETYEARDEDTQTMKANGRQGGDTYEGGGGGRDGVLKER